MKKFVVLAVLACTFSLAFAANPAHAQLLRRHRMRNYDSSPRPMYVYTESAPATYVMATGSQPIVYQDYSTPAPSRRFLGRRGRFSSPRGYTNAYAYGPAPYVGVATNGRPTGTDGSNPALALNARREGYRSFYSPEQIANQATIRVQLTDAKARVSFEDATTEQTGRDRVFASPPLDPTKSYTYKVRVTWMEDGHEMTKTKEIKVQAGREAVVDFREEK
jgi:uncharacterized protein (TIGR03000 family)